MFLDNPGITQIVINLPKDAAEKYPDLKDVKRQFENDEKDRMELVLVLNFLNERFQLLNDGPVDEGNARTYSYSYK